MRRQQWKKNGKIWKRYRHGSWRKSETKKRSDRWSNEWREKSSFCVINGSLSSQKSSVGAEISKVQRQSCIQRSHCERWFRIIRSISTRIISIKKDSSKSNGRYIQTSRMFRSNRCFVCSVHLTRIISVKKDSRKYHGHKSKTTGMCRTKQQTQQR